MIGEIRLQGSGGTEDGPVTSFFSFPLSSLSLCPAWEEDETGEKGGQFLLFQ